ncbi:MAG: hypothetical protein FJY97_20490 [candidate division Zixibacteria bacterium]|nr:hypothetical protein [candidate division Zixibacteria bacterium]
MSIRTVSSFGIALALVAVMGGACTPPPDAEKANAQQAVDAAKNDGAEMYAKTQLDAAAAEWAKAEQHMTAKEYLEAKAAYESTVRLAAEAGKEAGVQKEMIKTEASQGIDAFMTKWGEVSAAIEKGKGKDAKALAAEAGEYAKTITEQINTLKTNGQWIELKAAVEEASKKADEFSGRAMGGGTK